MFGLPIAIAGAVMLSLGFVRAEPSPPTRDPGKKFCWYCMSQIAEDAKECPDCSLPHMIRATRNSGPESSR